MRTVPARRAQRRPDSGVALVAALIITLVSFMLIMSTLYMITSSTKISGIGKRYATAAEAADGAVEVVKDVINGVWYNLSVSTIFESPTANCDGGATYNLEYAIKNKGQLCTKQLALPSAMGGKFEATITVEYLYLLALPGGRIEFAKSASSAPSTAIFYRITSKVKDANGNTTAENAALYRFTG